jgi:hypothetical protein
MDTRRYSLRFLLPLIFATTCCACETIRGTWYVRPEPTETHMEASSSGNAMAMYFVLFNQGKESITVSEINIYRSGRRSNGNGNQSAIARWDLADKKTIEPGTMKVWRVPTFRQVDCAFPVAARVNVKGKNKRVSMHLSPPTALSDEWITHCSRLDAAEEADMPPPPSSS